MSAFIVLGAQWGDEGKGKMTDYLAEGANVVVRYQGGNNAGHTVEVGEKQYKLHLIPSGILHDEKLNVIGNGVVVDPKAFFTEIDYLKEEGVKVTPEKLIVSDRAHVIMPYHKVLDKLKEKARGKTYMRESPITPPISHERFNFSFSFYLGTAFADGL